MKKSLLLVLMFITMFFVGSNEVFAFDDVMCQVGEVQPGTNDDCLTVLKEEYPTQIKCLYEVELNNGESYYNYIYQLDNLNAFYGGTTKSSSYSGDKELSNNGGPAWLVGDAHYQLYNNYQCPSNSYIDTNSRNTICFDNNGECLNNGSALVIGDNFNNTKSSSLLPVDSNDDEILEYKSLTLRNICDNSDLLKDYSNRCSYYDSNTGNYVFLLYGGFKPNKLIYNDFKNGNFLIINENEQQTAYLDNAFNSTIFKGVYSNNISLTNTCPNTIYLNFTGSEIKSGEGSVSNYSWSITKNADNKDSTTYFLNLDCADVVSEKPGEKNGCDLISDDLRNTLNTIMSVIRISVPILLIGLIIYDFVTAVFAGTDDKVNKAKQRAIKRIIIAIVIFFVPTLINFVLDIVNEVWGKTFSTCGIK